MAKLVLEGGGRKRLRAPDGRTWTKAKVAAFLRALAESCNVKLACKAAGVSHSQAYVRRAKDATFRAGWAAALSTGYAQLELMMLERALHGVEKVIVARDGSTSSMREYSDRVGLALLRMHRDSAADADEHPEQQEVAEAAERILMRLKRIAARQAADIETKGPGRVALIAWVLKLARAA